MFVLNKAKQQLANDGLSVYAITARFALVQSRNVAIAYVMRIVNVSVKTTEADRNKFYIATRNDESPKQIIDKLPLDYYDYVDLFNRQAAYDLPLYRPSLNYEIKLLLGTQPPFKRPYPMLALENEVIKHQVNGQLELSNIRNSNLPTAAPVLIVRKPSRGLRIYLDYRALNALTIKSRYLILLI